MKEVSIKLKSTSRKNKPVSVVSLEGDLTISNVADARNKIVSMLEGSQDVEVKVHSVENIDLTFLQLLYSVKKTIKAGGKDINISLDLGDDLKKLLDRSGLTSIIVN